MPDELLKTLVVPVPRKGLIDSLDPASEVYPPDASPDLLNFRVGDGKWQTRLGMTVWDTTDSNTFPGSGTVHFLASFYPSAALLSGARTRLLARNGTLYDLIVGTDTAFQSVASGLGTSPRNGVYNGAQCRDRFYITDRAGALKYYNGTALTTVTQGTAPTVAPTTRRRTFAILRPSANTNVNETWTGSVGSEPDNITDTAQFVATVADTTADSVPDFPGGGNILKMVVSDSGSKNDEVEFDGTTAIPLNSHDIAFFFQQEVKRWITAFEIGRDTDGSFSYPLDPLEADQTYLVHAGVGNLDYLKYVRFRVGRVPNQARTIYVSRLYLPGKLLGKYRYRLTFYNPTTGQETAPSPQTEFVDCSAVFTDTPLKVDNTDVLEKSVELTTLGNTLPDVTLFPKVRGYRNGGTASQTADASGQPTWFRIFTTGNINSSVATAANAGDLVLDVIANEGAENQSAGDWVVIEAGVADKAELVKVSSVTQDHSLGKDRITLDASTPLRYAHSVSTSNKVTPAYLDNTANESIDTSTRLEIERDDPPTGIHWISTAPDGRLWIARYEDGSGNDQPLVVAVSNRPNADRTNDQDVFPANVDPLSRRSLLQGWRFTINPRQRGDEIVWAGFFGGVYTVMLRRAVYQVHAASQSDWSPSSVVAMIDGVGCIAGETVCEANGFLYWVADGPRVVRWDGRQLEDLSERRIETTLKNAPADYWNQAFARVQSTESAKRYRLFFTPSGGTTNTAVLDYDIQRDAWEPCIYGSSAPWATAMVQDGPGDAREMVAAHPTSGQAYYLETGLTDAGSAITVRAVSTRFGFSGLIVRAEKARVHVAPTGADTLALRVRMGGSEYRNATDFVSTDGDPVADWNETLADTDTSEAELYQRLNFWRLKGTTLQVRVSGTVSNRPGPRDISVDWSAVRRARLTN